MRLPGVCARETGMVDRGFARMARQIEVLDFVGDTFHSVWALEVLRILAQAPDLEFTEDKLIATLRASKAAIGQSLAGLERVGLIAVGEGGANFRPINPDLEKFAHEAIDLYARRPALVRRTIVSRTSPGVTAFADAFKLRKDR
ncbi:MAG: hypothetical protein EOP17_00295 [Rhizobiaceae bacterium]|nr:MAG: hypothetical protein EOP17_00295 [Rhizobiaceae bacterium]